MGCLGRFWTPSSCSGESDTRNKDLKVDSHIRTRELYRAEAEVGPLLIKGFRGS